MTTLPGHAGQLPEPSSDSGAEIESPATTAASVRALIRRFWPETRPLRRWLALALVLVALGPVIETATIWLYKLLVDQVLVPQDFSAFPRLALAYLGVTLLGGAVSFGNIYLTAWVGERYLLGLRTRFFRHLLNLPLDFFEKRQLGDIIARLTGDIYQIEAFLLSGFALSFSYLLRIVFFTGALVYLQWQLALLAFVVAPLFWLAANWCTARVAFAAREQRKRSGAISAVAQESLGNVALVQAYNRQETEVGRFEREAQGNFAAEMALTRLEALFTPLVNLIQLGGVLIIVGAGAWQLTRGLISLGGLLVFLAYLNQLYDPVRNLADLANTLFGASAGAERIAEILDLSPAVPAQDHALRPPWALGTVRFEDVSFQYPGTQRDVLQNVSFEVGPGETLALVGASGAGKSTVTKLLLRFYDPTSGRILLDGHDLRDLDLSWLRENVAVLLQETLIFDGSARENIAYGRSGASDAEIMQAATAADAHEFIMEMPQGYSTLVGERGRRLSGGQQQRIAIARAMVRRAALLVLDEPTSGLDSATGERILAPLRRLMQGRTTIIVSHNLQTVREATVIIVLDHGRVVECGSHADLLHQEGTYAALYRQSLQEPIAPDFSKARRPRHVSVVRENGGEDHGPAGRDRRENATRDSTLTANEAPPLLRQS